MSAAKHTPGPWIWQHWPDGCDTVAQASTLGTVATIFPGPLAEEEQANACLIAAAPELLQELRNLELAANTVDACYTRNHGNFAAALRDLRDSAEAARAILAKATGQQPDPTR